MSTKSPKARSLVQEVVGVLGALVLGTVGMAMIPAAMAANDIARAAPLGEAIPIADLLQLCRDGSAETSIRSDIDANAIIQRYELARTACDRLVDDSHVEGRDLVKALLARADLLAHFIWNPNRSAAASCVTDEASSRQ